MSFTKGNLNRPPISGAMLVHDEHAPIVLNEGDYRVIRQREYIVSESEEDIEFTVVLD